MNLENLGPEAKQILALAKQESENLQHFYLGVEHIFIVLIALVMIIAGLPILAVSD